MPVCCFCYNDTGSAEHFHPRCCKRFFGILKVPHLELNGQVLRQLAERTVNKRIAVTGVQPKLSLTLENERDTPRLTIVGLWGDYILKPQHPHFPQMPQVEDLTMHLASLFKIPVCAHALIPATDGNLVYVAKRFDRVAGGKVHVEDFCQLSGFLTENKYKSSYEKAGKLVLQYCTNRGLDALAYFELLLFSFLTGNNDMHLKNFSVIHKEDSIVLSPAYDLLNVALVNPADNEELGMTLNAKKRKLRLKDFAGLAQLLGIPEKVKENTFKKFMSRNEEVAALIGRSFLSDDFKEGYRDIWLQRQKALQL